LQHLVLLDGLVVPEGVAGLSQRDPAVLYMLARQRFGGLTAITLPALALAWRPLALETFDPAGRSRTEDANGFVIDDDDVFFGTAFDGPAGLAAALKSQETLDYCMAERIGSHALGRGIDVLVPGDSCTVQDVIARSTANGGSFADLLLTLVETDAFQMRRAARTDDDTTATGDR
jgi:hypothetical protein